MWFAPDGGMQVAPVEVAVIRWGGGAKPGLSHVFTVGPWISQFLWFDNGSTSWQCVVDDFGNLVRVQ